MQDIKKKLKDIPAQYRPAPFWSWNDELEPEELKRQIRWMHDMGIGGFFMHARGGLKTSYMSDEWMKCIESCCDEAKKLGMSAWGYDENGWPSGFAGGKLLENEKNRDSYIEYSEGLFDAEADVSYLVTEDEIVRVVEKEAEGNYLNLYIRRSVSTVDICNPEVVKQFILLTHEKYKEYFGEAFPRKMKGFFTDEPQFYRGGGTPYTPMLEMYFKVHYGENVLDKLGLLFLEKEGWRTFRYRYWLAMQSLMLESFAKQIYEWCVENDVEFTGHYIVEELLEQQMVNCGGIMPFYEYMHIPGIDWLGKDTYQELGPRQVHSAACQMGKEQVLTETFAGCDWNCSPEEYRRIVGFQYANGANMMCHHLMPYSEHGQRKRDYPAHFTSMNPWIKDNFREFNDYFSRLGYLLATGEEMVKVAIMHPVRSAYFENQCGKEIEGVSIPELEEGIKSAMRTLSSRGIAFHFLDETLLAKHGFVNGNKIGCGKCSYDYLVFPHMLTMGRETEKLVRDFVQNGGKILLLDNVPSYLEGESYNYDYLQSNCELEDIIAEQPFGVLNTDNELYYAYRLVEGKPFLFVQNASDKKSYTQTFSFMDGSQSFMKICPITLENERLSMTITVHENESLLLFPTEGQVKTNQELQEVELTFKDAKVSFDDNYLTMDQVYYSKDGEQYVGPIYVNTLFQQLLQERYNGKLWIRYCFEVDAIPSSLTLIAEKDNTINGKVNGYPIVFAENWEEDSTFLMADIQPYVKMGENFYETVVNWHQSEETYYALFGENVTETLKNCICYEGEIEAVYLSGNFGVYSKNQFLYYEDEVVYGHDFYVGKAPDRIRELVTDGFPFFRGKIKLSQNMMFEQTNVMLRIMGSFLTARVWVNDCQVGKLLFERRIDVSPYIREGENKVEVEFTIGNHNLFGPLHHGRIDWMVCPWHFDVVNVPIEQDGNIVYRLQRFYT